MDNWNSKPPSPSLELSDLIYDLKKAVIFAGPFSGQYFAKVLIRLGIINHPDLAAQAILSEKSPVYQTVIGLSDATSPQEKTACAARFLKTAASVLGVSRWMVCQQWSNT